MMVARILCSTLIFGLSSVGASLFAAPREIIAPVEKIFIASGFDDNDSLEVSIYGNFSDVCYRVGPTGFSVDQANYKIQIWAKAYDYSSREFFCHDVLTPFLLTVRLGVLPKGTYTVEMVGQNIREKMEIARANSESPDEFFYAPVTHTQVEKLPNGKQELTISGQFAPVFHGCTILKEIRHYRNPKDVLVVLPIAEFIDDEKKCTNVKLDFEGKLVFDAFQDLGLLHVRVSNGNSQTQLI
jgi:hypothetical protein